MKKNNTKRALLLSVLSLLMCCTMLVGSTFAWFTDSVASKNNIITSGNLDVVLEYKTNWEDEWAVVDETTPLFKEGALYEPGYTEVVFLRVSNAGSLALKYNLNVNVVNELPSINVAGEEFKLSNYLQMGAYRMDEYNGEHNYANSLFPFMFGTRSAALASVANELNTVETKVLVKDAPVLAGDKTSQVVALVLTMPTSVGNEANHKTGAAAPTIELGVTLTAAQYTEENDSFDNQYDKDAEYGEVGPNMPQAIVETLPLTSAQATLGMDGAVSTYELDKAFRFTAPDTVEQAQEREIRYWHADFVVSADKDVAADSMALLGYYEAFCDDYNDGNWVALVNEGAPIAAGDEIRLLELLLDGGSMNYEELCNWVPVFDCAVSDLDGSNAGTTITVELRLYEVTQNGASTDVETGNYVVVGRYHHKF